VDDNIISVNIPNGLSILIMGAIGAIVLAFVRKSVTGKGKPAIASGASFTGG
jgi:hypothetical protein